MGHFTLSLFGQAFDDVLSFGIALSEREKEKKVSLSPPGPSRSRPRRRGAGRWAPGLLDAAVRRASRGTLELFIWGTYHSTGGRVSHGYLVFTIVVPCFGTSLHHFSSVLPDRTTH